MIDTCDKPVLTFLENAVLADLQTAVNAHIAGLPADSIVTGVEYQMAMGALSRGQEPAPLCAQPNVDIFEDDDPAVLEMAVQSFLGGLLPTAVVLDIQLSSAQEANNRVSYSVLVSWCDPVDPAPAPAAPFVLYSAVVAHCPP